MRKLGAVLLLLAGVLLLAPSTDACGVVALRRARVVRRAVIVTPVVPLVAALVAVPAYSASYGTDGSQALLLELQKLRADVQALKGATPAPGSVPDMPNWRKTTWPRSRRPFCARGSDVRAANPAQLCLQLRGGLRRSDADPHDPGPVAVPDAKGRRLMLRAIGRFFARMLCLKRNCPKCGRYFCVSNRGEWDGDALYACEKCKYFYHENY